ncbi:MAG TPA: 30S ribosomal protein S13 [Chitinophagales bacterium]|nr:30S ribosomal protein S13 [Chitinophagales bacterium]
MARLAGVDLPRMKRACIGLTYIYGVGNTRAKIDHNKKVKDLSDEEVTRLRVVLGDYTLEGELRAETQLSIKRLMDIGSYRGIRHRKGLPLRGQRTRTNARTRKGKRKTVAGKKKVGK